jgi:hypothetical protein
MKTFFLAIIILFFVSGNMYSDIPEINYEEYIGKEVSVFVGDLIGDLNRPDKFFFRDEPPGKLRGGMFYFEEPDNCFILINISTFNYIQDFNINRDWQFDDFLKETISGILVWFRIEGKNQVRIYPGPETPNGNTDVWNFFYRR